MRNKKWRLTVGTWFMLICWWFIGEAARAAMGAWDIGTLGIALNGFTEWIRKYITQDWLHRNFCLELRKQMCFPDVICGEGTGEVPWDTCMRLMIWFGTLGIGTGPSEERDETKWVFCVCFLTCVFRLFWPEEVFFLLTILINVNILAQNLMTLIT